MQDQRHDRAHRPSGADNLTARIQSLRSILSNSERHTTVEQQVALRALDREEQDRRSEMAETAGRPVYSHVMNDDGLFESQAHGSPSSIVRTRRQVWRTRERVERQRSRMERLSREAPSEASQSPIARLSPLNTARARPASSGHDDEPSEAGEGRRPKRRKLDDGTSDDSLSLPAYGLEGTLLPGNLNMKVLDTGSFHEGISQDDERAKLKLYQAGNKDIFRAKKHKATILMKHQGGWPFSLSKLVIKGPKHDYDTNSLQGMVFISMDDNLLESTAYHDSLFPAGYVSHRRRTYDSYRPSHDYLHSTRSPMSSLLPRQRLPPDPADAQWRNPRGDSDDPIQLLTTPFIHTSVDRLPPEASDSPTGVSPRSPRPWHDPESDYTLRYAHANYRRAYAPGFRMHRGEPSDPTADATLSDNDHDSGTTTNSDDDEPPLYRGVPPSRIELEEADFRQRTMHEAMRAQDERGEALPYAGNAPPYQSAPARRDDEIPVVFGYSLRHADSDATGTARGLASSPRPNWHGRDLSHPSTSSKRLPGCNEMLSGRGLDLDEDSNPKRVLPHATFQITRDGGSGVVVKFEPNVSGRYILVKLWTQCPNSSVAVQNIVPYGFAGLRQVADLSFR